MAKTKEPKDFSADFRKARQKKQMTQDEAADLIHRTKRQVQNIENRGQIPDADAFILACTRILNADPMDYIDVDEEEGTII